MSSEIVSALAPSSKFMIGYVLHKKIMAQQSDEPQVVFSNPSDTFNRKRNDEYHSILDLADETIEKIFEYSKDIPSVVCLALSCKRTFKIFDASKNRRDENRRWNNTSGPWKQQLMLLLARGWIPWWRTKLCYACWRFVPYGSKSKDRWLWLERLELCQKKKEQWKANWEVQLWLGGTQQDRKDTRDFRIRCPMCVLYDQALRLPGESMVQKICEGPQLLSLGDRQVQQEREEEKARRRKAWGEKLVKHSKNVGKKNGSKKLSPWAMEPRK